MICMIQMLVTRSFLHALRQFSNTNLSFDVTLRRLVNYECFFFFFFFFFCIASADFFSQNHLIRKILPEKPFVSNSLDPDQAPPNVGTELGPSCLQRLSADNTSRQNLIILLSQKVPFHQTLQNALNYRLSPITIYIFICLNMISFLNL